MKATRLCLCLFIMTAYTVFSTRSLVAAESRQHPLSIQKAQSFTDYIEQAADYVSKHSLRQRTVLEQAFNLPFMYTANPKVKHQGKFLLFHGLNDSPYVWRDMAEEIANVGFDVRVVLLPGHGTHPNQMLEVSYKEWLNVARAHLLNWDDGKTPIYLGGFSMGAVIATTLTVEAASTRISGLFLVSPAYHSKLNNLLSFSWLYKVFRPWMFGGLIKEDNPIKYNSIAINSGAQYYALTQYLKKRWSNSKINVPVLMLHSKDDSVVDVEYTRDLFKKRFAGERKQLIIYQTATQKSGAEEVFRVSSLPEQRILNQSHLSLINRADNPLFGENGRVLVCNGNEYPIYMACMRSREHWLGAQHSISPDGVAVARITYNPDFTFVAEAFNKMFLR